MRQIGIDPGLSGAIAWADDGFAPRVRKMPETERDIWLFVRSLASVGDVSATIEKVHNMAPPRTQADESGKLVKTQGRGSTANWELSGNYHAVRMALVAAGIGFEAVSPQKWQKEFGLVFRGAKRLDNWEKKRRHKAKAEQLWPGVNVTHATADALLLLEYARRRLALFSAEPEF